MKNFDYYKNLKDVKNYFNHHETTFSQYTKNLRYHYLLTKAFQDKDVDFTRVLEIGGGTGLLKKYLMPKTNFFVSYDLSIGLLKEQSKYGGFNILGNGLKLPFKDNSFSLIVLNEVIADFNPENLPVLLKELSRVIKHDKGTVFISEYGRYGNSKKVVLKDHVEYSIDFEKFKNQAKNAGFKKISIQSLMKFIKMKDQIVVSQKGVQYLIKRGFDKKMGEFYLKKNLSKEEKNFLNSVKDTPKLNKGKLEFKKPRFYHKISDLGEQFKAIILKKY